MENEAVLAAKIFAGLTADSLQNEIDLQTKISQISQDSGEPEIMILKPVEDGFQVVAANNPENLGIIYKSFQYTSSWLEGKNLTTFAKKNQDRFLTEIYPLKDSQGEKIALLNLGISLKEIDYLTQKTLLESLLILGLTVFFIMLLLFNHFRLFEYTVLFRRLKEVDKMKDDFISMASHELKAPMSAIKGYLDMIFEGVAGKIDKKAKEHLDKILLSVKRLDSLVNALLDVSRLEQGRIEFDMQAVNLSKIIKEIISEFKVQADSKKIKLTYQELPQPRPFVFVDPERAGQVLMNIIDNAIKYTLKGEITIFHKVEHDQLKTVVLDTGIGISREDMKNLFKKFYRIQNEKTADISGTGLGLWISREIANRMNGVITVESKEGIGSAFTVTFPIMKEK